MQGDGLRAEAYGHIALAYQELLAAYASFAGDQEFTNLCGPVVKAPAVLASSFDGNDPQGD